MLIRVALSIAGSDSGGGAGIQADIKTFAALGVYPCTVITAITAQNTSKVVHVLPIHPDSIRKQIESVISDIPVHAIKVGMVYNKKTLSVVAGFLKKLHIPIILDPILAAGTGKNLLLKIYLEEFKSELIPLSDVITPNVREAEELSGIKIKSESDIIRCAGIIKDLGAKSVIIKGGHFNAKNYVVDTLVDNEGKISKISSPRISLNQTHGSGCNFSSAVTAFIARNYSTVQSFMMANKYVQESMDKLINLGKGIPVNAPLFSLYDDAWRYRTVLALETSLEDLLEVRGFRDLIPETQTNFVYALPFASNGSHVAGVDGRIVRSSKGFKASGTIRFGSSKHVASAVISYMRHNPLIRSAVNIRFGKKLIDTCKSFYPTAEYRRADEPLKFKHIEGRTISWGVSEALSENPRAEIIYHTGDISKEAMILIFGHNPFVVVKKVKQIIKLS
ncbi:MAG TPA: bifunctional hydroxymethylpyrimidine kinase/phosphomethylpyrimidine kinase [Nitrososphaeraceae archaeon]